jgi:hypothetical protein
MLEILPDSQEDILMVKATGKLTEKDYQEVLIPRLETLLHEYGKAKFLFLMDEQFQGWEFGALWDDAKVGLRHRNDFAKVAVVGGARWVEWGVKLFAPFMAGEVKTFPLEQFPQAADWIKS